jgi:hypothetical protein
MYKLSEDISKSAFFMNLQRKSDFPTYHVIEAKKRYVLQNRLNARKFVPVDTRSG